MLKSKIMGIILITAIAFAAFAGGGGDRHRVDGNSKELRVLNYTDLTVANAAAVQGFQWGTFLNNNEDVSIIREDLFNEPFHNKIEAFAASGNVPDVIYVWPSGRSTTLHQNRLLKDLTPLINRDGLRNQFSAAALDPAGQASGYVAMIPQGMTATHVMFVNLEVLNAVGLQPARNYDELKAQVPVLRAAGYETILMPNRDTWVMQSCLFSMVAGRFGGADWHTQILAGRAKFTDADFVNALTFIQSLYQDGVLAPSSLGMDYGAGPGLFATNRGAYYIDGDWRTGSFITDQSTGQALITPARQNNIRVGVFPDIPGAKLQNTSSVVLGTGWAMSAAIPAGSAREDAAWRLIKWLVGPEMAKINTETGAFPNPTRTDINPAELNIEPIQRATAGLSNVITSATVVIDAVFHSDVFNVINDGLQEIGLGSSTPQQVAQRTQAAFDTWRRANPR